MITIPDWKSLRVRMLELMVRIQAGGPVVLSDEKKAAIADRLKKAREEQNH